MVIDETIKTLVKNIETGDSKDITSDLQQLIAQLHTNLAANKERYVEYAQNKGELTSYPVDADGYAQSFDPLEDEEGFWNAWETYGIVVGKQVVLPALLERTVKRMHGVVSEMTDGVCDLADPETWQHMPKDANETPFVSRGFFELYHDDVLAELRQSVRLYIHHVLIWGRVDLWSSFDRLGLKLPHHEESYGLPLHVDQNPRIHPHFKTLQGVLALVDCPLEKGTFVGAPGSRCLFDTYNDFAPERGEFVELDTNHEVAAALQDGAQAFPLRGGDIVSWDSRTTHANSENVSGDTRYVAYIAAGPAREADAMLTEERAKAFASGEGSNVREALMHASKKPRYTNPEKMQQVREPEQLTLLGKLLYGQEQYEKHLN